MVDTHCHLNFQAFNNDFGSVVRRYQEKGGEELIIPGAKIDSSKKAIEIAGKYPFCFASVGIHPHHTVSLPLLLETGKEIEKLASQNKVVAIGETGLDYYQYKNYSPLTEEQKEMQKQLFLTHLNVAKKLKLPVIIHCRKARLHSPPPDSALTQSMRAGSATADGGQAQDDLLQILEKFMKDHPLRGVIHCFEGTASYLEKVLALGFFVGFDGNITYKGNEELCALVKETPLDRLLLETDSPYLPPVPLRGQRNEPANLRYIVETVAGIKNTTSKEIETVTAQNAKSLFGLKKG